MTPSKTIRSAPSSVPDNARTKEKLLEEIHAFNLKVGDKPLRSQVDMQ